MRIISSSSTTWHLFFVRSKLLNCCLWKGNFICVNDSSRYDDVFTNFKCAKIRNTEHQIKNMEKWWTFSVKRWFILRNILRSTNHIFLPSKHQINLFHKEILKTFPDGETGTKTWAKENRDRDFNFVPNSCLIFLKMSMETSSLSQILLRLELTECDYIKWLWHGMAVLISQHINVLFSIHTSFKIPFC